MTDYSTVRAVALIPARGGSKGVPGKNVAPVGGIPLVARAVRACRQTVGIDLVVVSTDDAEIAAVARAEDAVVVDRPAELAGDHATSESALLHALDVLAGRGADPAVVVFVQCTSPFLDPARLAHGIELVASGAADAAFAAVSTYGFLWRETADGNGAVAGVNHDAASRPRRQDRSADHLETGGFYVMDVAGLRRHEHRFFGRTVPVAVAETTAIDVDTPADLALARAMADARLPGTDAGLVPVDVDVVFTDFDGVHTDDTAWVDGSGVEAVRVSRSDGMGVEQLRRAGIPLVIVSKETDPVVGARARKLGVEVAQGVEDKTTVVRRWLDRTGVPASRAAYLGNDVNDLAPMGLLGWPVAVADARPEVRRAARLVLTSRGGSGAVRELCDLVLAGRSAALDRDPAPDRAPSVEAVGATAGGATPG